MAEKGYPKIMHGIGGHLSRIEANWLYDTPKRIGSGFYAELGTFRGRSAICLAGGMQEAGVTAVLHTVDAYDGRNMNSGRNFSIESVRASLEEKGVEEYVRLYEGLTVPTADLFKDAWFDFLFIDAAHSYEGCKADFEAWKHKVVSGGEIAFHDAHKESVNRVVEESGWERYDVDTIAIIKKP